MPVLEKIEKNTDRESVVVADAAMLSQKHCRAHFSRLSIHLGSSYQNENKSLQKQILNQRMGMKDGDTFVITKTDGARLIISF